MPRIASGLPPFSPLARRFQQPSCVTTLFSHYAHISFFLPASSLFFTDPYLPFLFWLMTTGRLVFVFCVLSCFLFLIEVCVPLAWRGGTQLQVLGGLRVVPQVSISFFRVLLLFPLKESTHVPRRDPSSPAELPSLPQHSPLESSVSVRKGTACPPLVRVCCSSAPSSMPLWFGNIFFYSSILLFSLAAAQPCMKGDPRLFLSPSCV